MKNLVIAGALALAACAASAQHTPVGWWKPIDEDGKTETSLVSLGASARTLPRKIEKIFDPAKQDSKCDQCSDERKDKPVLGMTILRNLKQDADDPSSWTGGEILDPNNGKTYKARLKPLEGGKQLQMRGYLGPF